MIYIKNKNNFYLYYFVKRFNNFFIFMKNNFLKSYIPNNLIQFIYIYIYINNKLMFIVNIFL